jgi:UPF0716 protein FxsA
MLGILVLVFVLAPVVDLFLLYRIGEAWGFWRTAALVVGSAAVGFSLARANGTRMLAAFRRELAAGRPPGHLALDGVAVLTGSLLLIAPGPLTDGLGLLLLLPPTRRLLFAAFGRAVERSVERGTLRVSVLRFGSGGPADPPAAWEDAPPGLDPANEIRLPPPEGDR